MSSCLWNNMRDEIKGDESKLFVNCFQACQHGLYTRPIMHLRTAKKTKQNLGHLNGWPVVGIHCFREILDTCQLVMGLAGDISSFHTVIQFYFRTLCWHVLSSYIRSSYFALKNTIDATGDKKLGSAYCRRPSSPREWHHLHFYVHLSCWIRPHCEGRILERRGLFPSQEIPSFPCPGGNRE